MADEATGAPLEGIRVAALDASSAEPILTLTTDAVGFYAFETTDTSLPALRIRFTDPQGAYAPVFHGADADAFCTASPCNSGHC